MLIILKDTNNTSCDNNKNNRGANVQAACGYEFTSNLT